MPEKETPESATPTDEDANPVEVPDGLYPKLLLAQRLAKGVGKAGRNEDQKYNYAKAEDVIAEAQRALHEAGLVAFMRPGEIESREVQAKSGTGGLFVTLSAELVIVDPTGWMDTEGRPIDNMNSLVIPATGTGIDYPGDKAVYKAMTGAAKYAYSSALGIPFTDDPERDVAGAGQDRKAQETEASPAQKRLLTQLFNRAGIAPEIKKATVFALAGQPVTKLGASAILDRIADLPDEKLRPEIEKLIDEAGARPETAGLPGDDVPPDENPDPADAEQGILQGDTIGDPNA